LRMRKNKKPALPTHCDWCGTRYRLFEQRRDRRCARGPACAKDKAAHEAMDELVAAAAKRGRRDRNG